MTVVLDASITIAWLFGDERTPAVEQIMTRIVTDGAVVPSLWRLEVANVLRGAVRRGRCDEAFADRSLERLSRLPIHVDGETDNHAWGRTRELSRVEDLTLYDAAYLELGIRRQFPIASHDAALIAAARRHEVELTLGD
jgi:predicted nucleic acid-binding protein